MAIAVLDLDAAGAKETADGLPRGSWHEADVSSCGSVGDAVTAIMERWGRIDVLVDNAFVTGQVLSVSGGLTKSG